MIRAASRLPQFSSLLPLVLLCSGVFGQIDAPSTNPAAPATIPAATVPSSLPAVQSYSVSELADRAEATTATLKRVNGDLSGDQPVVLDERLSTLTTEIEARLEEGEKRLPTASLETLRTLEREWAEMRREITGWSTDLASRLATLQRDEDRLASMAGAWEQTLADIGAASGTTEREIVSRVQSLRTQIAEARSRITARSSQFHSLQGRTAIQDVRVGEAMAALRDAQSRAVDRLLQRDADPVWTGRLGADPRADVAEGGRNSFTRQWIATWAYASRNSYRFVGHLFLIGVLAFLAHRVGRNWGAKLEGQRGDIARSATLFQTPIASAIVATLPLVPWLYPQAPRLLLGVLVGAMFVPVILVLRRLVLKPLVPLLYALGIFYVLGLLVSITDAVPALSRAIFLFTMIGAAGLVSHFLWRTPRIESYSEFAQTLRWKVIQFALRITLILMTASAVANIIGFVSLSRLLGDGVLSSAYIAIMLDATVRVIQALLAVLFQVRPISTFGVVRRHGQLLLGRVTLFIAWGAAIWWALLTLEAFAIRRIVLENAGSILTARWGIGAVNLSLGGILAFIAAVVASFLISRFIRFILNEDVYPRVHLARGVPYAVSTLLHYIVLFVGFLIAVALLGYDMTKFTILAGAFGVGLGFGMQNIVNNFVSGLILLFERPIQVGDVIELDPATIGVISRIGIRASVLRTSQAAEVIVPNGMLIANRVTNWTLSNRQRAFEVEISIGEGTDPQSVIDLLIQVAQGSSCVARVPAPQAYVTELVAGGGIKFELRVWTERFDDWIQARSEVISAIHSALAARSISRL